ncbi:HAD family hydrolase [Marinagarivorans cellulosilyticus]|uniref:N-acetyl-D-muramate 6-phosphate phosphatase n=1 Tax=Marinagarivorans cellulosilyticus TaxID=2721545 RepID=A0AAN2BLK9_9GAMM|nr:HAD-IA family hydrolase [Marinagarivorans cellulosilyticus]BCD99199.1 N-acetyl-D-muramate 6-phosphate phosphatase [Marinagarivorans cellulosilyticus]
MIEAVFFDLDGTLMDTSKDLGAALNAVRQAEGLPPLPDHITRAEVSNGANALIKLGFGEGLTADQHQFYRQALLDYYLANIAEYTFTFKGIEPLIQMLSDERIHWGVVTNKPALYTNALMAQFQFATAPAATVSPDALKAAKPDPEGLLLACQQANCAPAHCVYVGDHLRDIQAGKNAGMKTIAVGYGFTSTQNCHHQWQADYTVDCATEIWPIIQQLHKPKG